MKKPTSLLGLACLVLVTTLTAASQISIDPDGGYKGIVIQIDKNVPEEQCPKILSNLKVRLLSTLLLPMMRIMVKSDVSGCCYWGFDVFGAGF